MSKRNGRETWLAWLPAAAQAPDELVTRAELVDHLARAGVDVSARNLRHLEYHHILPHPVLRSYAGAVQATYPYYMFEVVASIAPLRRRLPHDRLGTVARQIFAVVALLATPGVTVRLHAPLALPEALEVALRTYLADHGGGEAELTIRLGDGRDLTTRLTG